MARRRLDVIRKHRHGSLNRGMSGCLSAAITSFVRSSGLDTFSLDSPVGSTSCVLRIPGARAFAFIAATNRLVPPG